MVRRIAVLVAASLLVAVPGARADDRTAEARDDASFRPVRWVITKGDTVVWRNTGDNLKHTVTSFDGQAEEFDSSSNVDPFGDGVCFSLSNAENDDCIEPGGSFDHTFNRVGTFYYYCEPHGNQTKKPDVSKPATQQPCGMCGVIEVRSVTVRPTLSSIATNSSKPRATGTVSPSARASTGATPGETLSPSPGAPGAGPTNLGRGTPIGSKGGAGGGRIALALLAIVALSGAAYATWRRFLAERP